jgi:hypothetical protein
MAERGGSRVHERWARLRFSVIGQLLASPPAKGALRAALKQLAAREWRHPSTGAPVRFGVSTLERWLSAEQIVLRSRGKRMIEDLLMINNLAGTNGSKVSA